MNCPSSIPHIGFNLNALIPVAVGAGPDPDAPVAGLGGPPGAGGLWGGGGRLGGAPGLAGLGFS